MATLRIGIDCRLPFYQRGGISQYTLQLIEALANLDSGHRYTIFHMGKDPANYLPAGGRDPAFKRVNLFTPCHHRLEKWSLGLEISLRQPQLDILHSPDFIPPLFGPGRKVITVHDLNFLYFPEFLTAESLRYYRDQIRWAVAAADHISADSEQTRQDCIELLGVPPAKITTVYLSVDPLYQQSWPAADIAATLAHHTLNPGFILVVGTLEPRKNLSMLLHAYRQARQEHGVDVPLVLVGRPGWLYEEIFETIADLELGDSVRHLTGVSNVALAHLYHAAGLLATPSHYEGFGLPALEALNCGCPVVVSDRGSLPEIAGDAGLILPPDDVDGWAAALARVLADSSLRESMAAAGRRHAASFSWERAAQQTLHIYETVAA